MQKRARSGTFVERPALLLAVLRTSRFPPYPPSRARNFMMKQLIVWTLAALIFVAAYGVYLAYSDAKADCAEQQVVSTTFCAVVGS